MPPASSAGLSAWPRNPLAPLTSTRVAAARSAGDALTIRDARRGYAGFFSIEVMNARRKSTGTGKIVVELFSVAISASVCR